MTSSQWLDLAVLADRVRRRRSPAGGPGRSARCCRSSAWCSARWRACCWRRTSSATSTGTRTKLFVALFLILGLVVIGEIAGVVLGRAVRGAIRNRALRTFDSVIGVALQVVAVLVAAWLLATPLTSSDQPNLAAAVRGSKVLAEVDEVAPPWLKTVPTRLSALLDTSGLPDVLQPFGRTPDRQRRRAGRRAGERSRRRRRRGPACVKIRGVAPSCQKVLEGSGFVVAPNRVMSNAHVVAGADDRHRRGRRPDLRRDAWCPTTPTPTSRSSTCRTCRRAPLQFDSRRPATRAPTRWCSATPAAATSPRPRRGSARSSSSTVPTSTTPRRSTARCTPSEALCGKVIRVAR